MQENILFLALVSIPLAGPILSASNGVLACFTPRHAIVLYVYYLSSFLSFFLNPK